MDASALYLLAAGEGLASLKFEPYFEFAALLDDALRHVN
jgi:hypothetical protein